MNNLKLGKMKNEEIADFFGIGKQSFLNNKDKKLEELKAYAEFTVQPRGVTITKILSEEPYKKQPKENANASYQKIKAKVDEIWSESGLDSCSHVSEQLTEALKGELALAPSTIYNYTRKSRNELYGKPYSPEGGPLGRCVYLWCKKIDCANGVAYEKFTPEEEQIKNDLIKLYFGDITEKSLMIRKMIKDKELTSAEAWDYFAEITNMNDNNFFAFLNDLSARVGNQVVRGTLVERNGEQKIIAETACLEAYRSETVYLTSGGKRFGHN